MRRRSLLKHTAAAVAAAVTTTKALSETHNLHTIEISMFAFNPATLQVRAGDRVRWVNLDIVPHTATADSGGWDTGEIAANESVQVTISTGMDGPYYCGFHPMMKGRLNVN